MQIHILGVAAGGGLPQWNCRCSNCVLAREGSEHVSPATQSSVAISSDGFDWYLLNVSPDVRAQVMSFPPLTPPGDDPRATGIAGCVLTDAEIDHTSGLLFLREGTLYNIYSTPSVERWLRKDFPVYQMLSAFKPRPWSNLSFDEPIHLTSHEGRESNLWVTTIDLDPHPPLFVTDDGDTSGSCVALLIEDRNTGGRFLYAPGVEAMTNELNQAAHEADIVFFDGTFWTLNEMVDLGLAARNAMDMGHWPITGDDGGSLEWFKGLPAKQKVFFHINNTNPMLNRSTSEYQAVLDAGIQVGQDGNSFEI
jgi:pyrroloquinoline quinone biosynthesis protein B